MKKLYIVFDQIPSLESGGLIVTYINMVKQLKKEYDIRIISVFKSEDENEALFQGIQIYNLSQFVIDNRFFRILNYIKNKKMTTVLKAIYSAFYFFAYIPIAKKKVKSIIQEEDYVISVSPTASMFLPKNIQFIQDIHTNYEYFWGDNKFGSMQTKLMSNPKVTVFRNQMDARKGQTKFKSTYLYNFVEEIKYDINTYNVESRKNKILFMGRLHPQKDPLRLVECAKILKEKGFQFELDVYGTGLLKDDLEKKILENNLSNEIKLRGYVDSKLIYKEYSMLWLTSVSEGFGLCIIEAKANATPTVSINWGGAIEEVIDNGIDGFIANDNEEFVEYTIELLNNNILLEKMAKSAYENYHKKFANGTTKKQLIDILESYKDEKGKE